MTGSWRWWIFTCSPFAPQTKFLPCSSNIWGKKWKKIQIESSSMKDGLMGYILFSLSVRLRQGAAIAPSQSVTATVSPAVTQQEGSNAMFYQTHCQHSSSICGLFFGLQWTPSHGLLHASMQSMPRQKETAPMWVQVQGCDTDGTGYTIRNT